MDSKILSISRYQVLSGSALKLIACLSMLADHLSKCYLCRFAWFRETWFTVLGRSVSAQELMMGFGRFAFPLFVFLLVIGFENTRNRTRYGISLFILALLSELPFNLMLGGALHFPVQNVIFTLLLGYLAMWSLMLTLLYNGQRGFIKTPFLKYCFYAFYPVHMLVVYWLSRS